MTESIRAVSFDGDMTLWDFIAAMRRSLGHTLAQLRRRVPCQAADELTVDGMIDIRDEVASELAGCGLTLEEIRFRAFQRTVDRVGGGGEALAKELNALYLKLRLEDIELYPDARPALDALAPHYPLGLLSNGNTSPERCGLADHFAFVIFAQDVGCEKPDGRIFQVACARAGCEPHQLAHVGDSLETDVDGANRVGALSVWLNRDHLPRDPDIPPAFEIRSLAELVPLLTRNRETST